MVAVSGSFDEPHGLGLKKDASKGKDMYSLFTYNMSKNGWLRASGCDSLLLVYGGSRGCPNCGFDCDEGKSLMKCS